MFPLLLPTRTLSHLGQAWNSENTWQWVTKEAISIDTYGYYDISQPKRSPQTMCKKKKKNRSRICDLIE